MAEHYRDATVRPDVEFLGGTKTRAVLVLSAWTVPHDVYFEARYPASGYTTANVIAAAEGFGIVLEGYFDIPGVDTISWSQIETQDGQLQDAITFYVSSTSGESFDTLTVPYKRLARGVDQAGFVNPDKAVPALRAKLDRIEAS
jgi:hypothetical protein